MDDKQIIYLISSVIGRRYNIISLLAIAFLTDAQKGTLKLLEFKSVIHLLPNTNQSIAFAFTWATSFKSV